MKNLQLPTVDNVELWESIVANKRIVERKMLNCFKEKIINRYNYYKLNFTSLENMKPLVAGSWDGIKDKLIKLYGNNIELKKVKLSLLNGVRCPYCTLNRSNTLDHYFDKSNYPEYSVYIPNLVPCCSECNSIKGAKVFNDDGRRSFIHFYLDYLPDYKFLFVKFPLVYHVPKVSISMQFKDNEPMKDLIEAHFKNLNLLTKLKETISDQISVIILEIQNASQSGEKVWQIRSNLTYRYLALAEQFGENNWKTCMYEGVLSTEGFIEAFL